MLKYSRNLFCLISDVKANSGNSSALQPSDDDIVTIVSRRSTDTSNKTRTKRRKPRHQSGTSYRKARTTLLAFGLLLGHSVTVCGAGETMADFMAEAMSRMMQAMGSMSNTNGGNGAAQSGPPTGQSLPGTGMMPYGAMLPGMSTWNMPFQGPSQMFGMHDKMDQLGLQLPGKYLQKENPWLKDASSTPFEGLWEGANGELVIVQGDRFRIYAPGTTFVDGIVKVQGDRVALYNPADQQARPFDYAMQQGRLVLRDDAGQLFLYRRLLLDRSTPAQATLGER